MTVAISGAFSPPVSASVAAGNGVETSPARRVRPLELDYLALGLTPDDGSFTGSYEVLPMSEPGTNASASSGIALLDDAVFDWRDYLARYPDLAAAGITTREEAIDHWLTFGIAEGRQGSPGFNVQAYLDANPDVKASTDDRATAIAHYVMYGRAEGRSKGDLTKPTAPITTPAAGATDSPIPADGITVGNNVVQLGVAPRTGGAINSLVVAGREYLNDFDHGRQMQVAWQMNHGGEGNNPTEAGSGADGVGPTTSSNVLAATASATGLTVATQPAWWLQSGDNVPASGAAATNGGSTSAVSNQVLTKSVEVGVTVGGVFYPNIIRHDASITFPDGAEFAGMEMPTAYLQGDFDTHYVYDIDSSTLQKQTTVNSTPGAGFQMETAYSQDPVGPRHRPNPFILATADGKSAMAIVPSLPMPAGFDDQLLGRMSFPIADPAQATQKMSALMTASNIPPGSTLAATTYVVVGTLEEVQRALAAMYG